jgi:hypothetical protein
MTALAVVAAGVTVAALVQGGMLLVASARRRRFYRSLGPVVRIGTPCRIVEGAALLPGALALTPEGLVWQGLAGAQGAARFVEIKRIETDTRLLSGRPLLRSEALRVTRTSGEVVELVLDKGAAWEWHQALGEWIGAKGALNANASAPEHSTTR